MRTILMALGIVVATIFPAKAAPSGLNSEHISHYTSEVVPPSIQDRLPSLTDWGGMKDIFFYPDGLWKGRIVHMRVPANYTSYFGEDLPRHSDYLEFGVVYPELTSVTSPDVREKANKNRGTTLDEAMSIGIERPQSEYLNEAVSRFLDRIRETRINSSTTILKNIPVPAGFMSENCFACRWHGLHETIPGNIYGPEIADTYIEWDDRGNATRVMTCMHTARPNCRIKILLDAPSTPYTLSIFFHIKYLNKLPEIIDRANGFIAYYFVETL